MSLRPEFNEDPGWETLDDRPVYSPEELAAFEKQRREEIEYLIKAGKVIKVVDNMQTWKIVPK